MTCSACHTPADELVRVGDRRLCRPCFVAWDTQAEAEEILQESILFLLPPVVVPERPNPQSPRRAVASVGRDLSGRRFGRITFIAPSRVQVYASGIVRQWWRAECDCGRPMEVRGDCAGQHAQCLRCANRLPRVRRAHSTPIGNTTVAALAAAAGVRRGTVWQRIVRGWPVERLGDPVARRTP